MIFGIGDLWNRYFCVWESGIENGSFVFFYGEGFMEEGKVVGWFGKRENCVDLEGFGEE